ncbi:acyl-CoA dehydrogenase family protein [Klebsiella variicola subsp. variicola]|nr:acyl-CoA dehydrogenase family protein [Klebsiella variicola subsp. variicola]
MMSASSPAQPYTQSTPQAHIIASDAEALAIAHEIAAVLKPGAAERDRTGIVPAEIVNTYSNSGLWGITVPRRFGGAEVSAATLAQVIAILSAADPSLGQIPRTTTACWRIFVCRAATTSRRSFSPGYYRAIASPMPCRKPGENGP